MQGVFYNDLRDGAAEDYSFPIRQFCSERNITFPCPAPEHLPAYAPAFLQNPQLNNNKWGPHVQNMQKTLFQDLHLRVSMLHAVDAAVL